MNARRRSLLVASLAVATVATAADKKAESELRWGLTYCSKLAAELEAKKANPPEVARIRDALPGWDASIQKYEDYFAKAKAIDASVTESSTVFDKKTGATYADTYKRCQSIPADVAAFRAQVDAAKDERAAAKAKEQAAADEQGAHDEALAFAKDALWGTCTSFTGRAGTSGVENVVAMYEGGKKKALERYPKIVEDSLTYDLRGADGTEVKTTKTIGEWFAFCDKMMPEHVAMLREKEAKSLAADEALSAKMKADNDKLREAEKARFNALVAGTSGDRQRVLKSHGFEPKWPRNGDVKSAPVWKWEINITHEPVRCETFQFSGNTLKKNFTSLGPCP